MSKFTKTYNVQPNEKQVLAIRSAFKMMAQHFVNEGHDVEVTANTFRDSNIVVALIVDGRVDSKRIIGVRGGLTVV